MAKVLTNLDAINQFRKDQSSNNDLFGTIARIFPNGVVWNAFLLHMAKPHVYPIADQNVFRACSVHTRLKDSETWETYAAYRDYFTKIAESLDVKQEVCNLRELKRIDNALFVFGQFLKAYHPRFAGKPNSGKKG